jgi:hypothetical protein
MVSLHRSARGSPGEVSSPARHGRAKGAGGDGMMHRLPDRRRPGWPDGRHLRRPLFIWPSKLSTRATGGHYRIPDIEFKRTLTPHGATMGNGPVPTSGRQRVFYQPDAVLVRDLGASGTCHFFSNITVP